MLLTRSLNCHLNRTGEFHQELSSTIETNVFVMKL